MVKKKKISVYLVCEHDYCDSVFCNAFNIVSVHLTIEAARREVGLSAVPTFIKEYEVTD